jgi:hypothetical protein
MHILFALRRMRLIRCLPGVLYEGRHASSARGATLTFEKIGLFLTIPQAPWLFLRSSKLSRIEELWLLHWFGQPVSRALFFHNPGSNPSRFQSSRFQAIDMSRLDGNTRRMGTY